MTRYIGSKPVEKVDGRIRGEAKKSNKDRDEVGRDRKAESGLSDQVWKSRTHRSVRDDALDPEPITGLIPTVRYQALSTMRTDKRLRPTYVKYVLTCMASTPLYKVSAPQILAGEQVSIVEALTYARNVSMMRGAIWQPGEYQWVCGVEIDLTIQYPGRDGSPSMKCCKMSRISVVRHVVVFQASWQCHAMRTIGREGERERGRKDERTRRGGVARKAGKHHARLEARISRRPGSR